MNIVCLLGKSGAGKSSIEASLEKLGYNRLVSYTTRKPRDGEVDGREYHFVTLDEFKRLMGINHFMEHATYAGNLYGSPKPIGDKNNVIVVEGDGYRSIKKCMGNQVVGVYIDINPEVALNRIIVRSNSGVCKDELSARIKSDNDNFVGIQEEVDLVVDGMLSVETQTVEILKYIATKSRGVTFK